MMYSKDANISSHAFMQGHLSNKLVNTSIVNTYARNLRPLDK